MSPCTATNIINHRLSPVRWIKSDNFDKRPQNTVPKLIVIHSISLPPGKFGGDEVVDLFTNNLDWDAHPYFQSIRDLKVSAHVFVRRNGELIQFVDFDKRAWHAGLSEYQGVSHCNDFSIGIELEGTDNAAYTDMQYHGLAIVCKLLKSTYKIDDVVGHCDISPGRKTDPGSEFDWDRLKRIS